MTVLDLLPDVNSFFGLDLKTGSLMIAVIGIVHPMAYGCTFFIPMSCLICTIWTLVAVYCTTSVVLFYGVLHGNKDLCFIWLWYAFVFFFMMFLLMLMLAILYNSRRQCSRVLITVLGMIYYLFTIYFIIVVNAYRKRLK